MSEGIFTLTVHDHGKDTRAAEVQQIAYALTIAAQRVRSQGGAVESEEIIGEGGVVLGEWHYTGLEE